MAEATSEIKAIAILYFIAVNTPTMKIVLAFQPP
jgi:hypothetical protein